MDEEATRRNPLTANWLGATLDLPRRGSWRHRLPSPQSVTVRSVKPVVDASVTMASYRPKAARRTTDSLLEVARPHDDQLLRVDVLAERRRHVLDGERRD